MKAVMHYCPELTQNFACNFEGTEIRGCHVKSPCSTAINLLSIRDIYTPDLLNQNFRMYWNAWETPLGLRATDREKWLRKPVSIKDLQSHPLIKVLPKLHIFTWL